VGLRLELEFVATFLGERQTNKSAAVDRHEIHDLGCDHLGRTNKITLILAIFVVNDYYHLAASDVLCGLFDRG
jgi:hypothetical protein